MNEYGYIVFLVAITSPIAWMIFVEARAWYCLSRRGHSVLGSIIDKKEKYISGEDGYHHWVVYRYLVEDAQHGTRVFSAREWVPAWFFNKYDVGQAIKVRYSPSHPELVRIEEELLVNYGLRRNKVDRVEEQGKSSLPNQAL